MDKISPSEQKAIEQFKKQFCAIPRDCKIFTIKPEIVKKSKQEQVKVPRRAPVR